MMIVGGAMFGDLCQDCGRGRWWANCVIIVGGGDGGRTVSGSWPCAMVGELCRDRDQGRYLVLTVLKVCKLYGALFYMTNVANHFPLAS